MDKVAYQNFNDLYSKHDPVIRYRAMQAVGGMTPDWEDVRAEVYLSLWKTLSGSFFRGDCRVGTLVYIIVQRRIADFMRTKYKVKETVENLISSYEEKALPDPEQSFMEKENRKILQLLIQKLQGWRQKQVIRLYLLGMSISEISRQLGPSPSSISQSFNIAKRNLKKSI